MKNAPPREHVSWAVWLSLVQGAALTALAKAIGFGTTILQSNSLGAAIYGQYAALLSTISLFGIAAQASLGAAASNLAAREVDSETAEAERVLGAVFSLVLFTAGLACTGLMFLAPRVAASVYRAPSMGGALAIAALSLVALSVQAVLDGALAAVRAFKSRNALPCIQAASFFLFASLLTRRFGLIGAISAYSLSCVPSVLFGIIALAAECRRRALSPRLFRRNLPYRRVVRFSLPMCANAVVVVGSSWLITTALARSSFGFVAVGQLNISTQIRVLLLAVPFLLHSTYTPLLNAALGSRDTASFRSHFAECYRVTASVSIASSMALMFIAVPLASAFGRDFTAAAPVISLTCVLAALMSSCNLFGIGLIALGRTSDTVIPNVVAAGASATAAILLGHRAGAFGVVLGMIVGQVLQLVMLGAKLHSYARLGMLLLLPIASTIGLTLLYGCAYLSAVPRLACIIAVVSTMSVLAVANIPDLVLAGVRMPAWSARLLRIFRWQLGPAQPLTR